VIQDIPVILLTAKAMVSDRIKGYKAGADGYLPKPFRPEELLRMVDNLMKRQDRERRARLTGKLYNSEEHGDHALSETEIAETTRELREIRQLLQKAI
jgi:DNA-binding response OmpR family regulator